MYFQYILPILSLPLLSLAQTPAQQSAAAALAAQIPACARACDNAAILAAGCGLTEYLCHCAHGSFLAATIPPCLIANSTCTSTDLATFAALPAKICAAIGFGTSTTSSALSTSSSSSHPTVGPTGTKSQGPTGGSGGATATASIVKGNNGVGFDVNGGLFAMFGAGLMAVFL